MKDVTLDLSKLHPWSIGIVVKDIEEDTDIVEVYPIEKIPDVDINLWMKKEFKSDITNTYPKDNDKNDDNEIIILKKEIAIRAVWLGDTQYNRITPPTIRKEEYVQLYRYSNADIFFWDTIKNDPRLRKEEIVIHAYSDKPDIDPNETIDNMVYQKIDTKNKVIHFHTPDKNGGLTTYDFTLDYKTGYFELLDGKQNQIKLDSDKNKFNLHIEGNENQYDLIIDGDNGYFKFIDDKGNEVNINSKGDKYTLTTNKDIETNTKNETKNIIENLKINLDKVAIENSTTELITLLIEWLDACIIDEGIGNLGIPVPRTSITITKYEEIKSKMETLKI